jgi:hypothetical protein
VKRKPKEHAFSKRTHLLGTLGGLCCTILRIKGKKGKFASGVNA